MKRIAVTLSSVIFLFLLSENTLACWCRHDPAEKVSSAIAKELRRSVIVFSGVATIRDRSGLKFRVEKVWKGKLTNEIIFNSKMYAARDTDETEVFINSCTFLFEVGKKYLVYAYRDGVDLFVNKCSRTQLLDSADEDINVFDRLVPKAQSFSRIGFGEIVSGTAKSDVALGADSP